MYTEKKYKCLECGWYMKTDIHDLKCPICQSDLQVELSDEEEDNNITGQIEKLELEDMEQAIKEEGHSKIWHDIETIKDPATRMVERRVFIKAGGVVPRNFEIRT